MYAIIKCGGKQYKVSEGDFIDVDYLNKPEKEIIEITDVLAVNNGELVTNPENAKVTAEVVVDGTGTKRKRKVIIFKKRRRKDSKLKRGFRRSFTKLKITSIVA